MNTGSVFGGRPSLGSWVSYGLGTENQNLPGFVVIKDTSAMIVNGTRCWENGFMPATHQGVLLENGPEPDRQSQTKSLQNQTGGRFKTILFAKPQPKTSAGPGIQLRIGSPYP